MIYENILPKGIHTSSSINMRRNKKVKGEELENERSAKENI